MRTKKVRIDEIARYLKRDQGQDRWTLSEPHLLYLDTEQSQAYLKAMTNTQYSKGFHSETVEIITSNIKQIVGQNNLTFIDLGPGYPDKAIPIGEYCKCTNIDLKYLPVDISASFLKTAEDLMSPFCKSIRPIKARFEECVALLSDEMEDQNLIVMIGLTFMNFPSKTILPILKKLVGHHGRALIASEIVDDKSDIPSILEKYEIAEAREVALGPLKALGIRTKDVNYKVRYDGHRIEMEFVLLKDFTITGKSIHLKKTRAY